MVVVGANGSVEDAAAADEDVAALGEDADAAEPTWLDGVVAAFPVDGPELLFPCLLPPLLRPFAMIAYTLCLYR